MQIRVLIILLISVCSLNAQSDSIYTPLKSHKYITLGIFGNSTFINYRVYNTDKTALRFSIDASYDETEETYDYTDSPDAFQKVRNMKGNFSGGIQRKLMCLPRLETYVGVDLSAGYANFLNIAQSNDYSYNSSTGSYDFEYTVVSTREAGYVVPSLKPFVGCNFFVYKGLSLGVEYRIPLISRYYQISDVTSLVYKDILGNIIDAPPDRNPVYNVTRKTNSVHYGIIGNTMVTASFRIR